VNHSTRREDTGNGKPRPETTAGADVESAYRREGYHVSRRAVNHHNGSRQELLAQAGWVLRATWRIFPRVQHLEWIALQRGSVPQLGQFPEKSS